MEEKVEIGKIAKILGNGWKKIKAKDKAKYDALAKKDKER